ncbi:Sec-independent protein translocase TatA [Halogranum amylolyticum]|uniref:Sec-independent protein translocase TatA n=1 Tax=Halogranum amylolyticum TaxID=660520 RepID=A0A1H8P189_9EURY|nr:twin-arginine translocase TatA/TatE family subunit [Halogranum amylolyticum]SEO35679.1 Sec-independent protein translocase TatA [Halogranum amylolyticum]
MYDSVPLFGPIPGGPELLIILAVIVLLFGANRLPELAHASGRAMGEFRRGREEIEQEIRAAANAERDTAVDSDAGTVGTGGVATGVDSEDAETGMSRNVV